mmetsp:Transcript_56992/g.127253  ORF Transcript_56992/g.127253 Transcript_56992/m.127253 type:complete len:398 (-) Transcript_56992:680-1873(-)
MPSSTCSAFLSSFSCLMNAIFCSRLIVATAAATSVAPNGPGVPPSAPPPLFERSAASLSSASLAASAASAACARSASSLSLSMRSFASAADFHRSTSARSFACISLAAIAAACASSRSALASAAACEAAAAAASAFAVFALAAACAAAAASASTRSDATCSCSSRTIFLAWSIFSMGRVWIFLAWSAYRNVVRVCSAFSGDGSTAQIMMVWLLPPSASLRIHVRVESRYGTSCELPCASCVMHLPSPSRLLLILLASAIRDWSSFDLDRPTFSEPARSIKLRTAVRSPLLASARHSCTIACEREDSAFIAVSATLRTELPRSSASSISSGFVTGTLSSPSTYTPCLPPSRTRSALSTGILRFGSSPTPVHSSCLEGLPPDVSSSMLGGFSRSTTCSL